MPYSAWKHASDQALYVLYRLYCSLFIDARVAHDFNYSWLVLLAKGEQTDDELIVARGAEDTRPVSLPNSDSKICEIALNKPLAKAVEQGACLEQRGFIEGRMLVDNVLEIDTYGRICSIATRSHAKESKSASPVEERRLPAMLFSDFAAAFPALLGNTSGCACVSVVCQNHIFGHLRNYITITSTCYAIWVRFTKPILMRVV